LASFQAKQVFREIGRILWLAPLLLPQCDRSRKLLKKQATTCLSAGADVTTTVQGIEIRPVFQYDGFIVSLLIAAVGAAARTYHRGEDPPGIHFAEFRGAPPEGNSVEVCHAYTCQMKTDFYFRPKDIQDIAAVMRKTKKGDTPFQDRRAIAYAIAPIEKKVGTKLGIKDRAGMEFGGTGDPTSRIAWPRRPTPRAISSSSSRMGC
jgi:hypothetical protein